jgi:hypothetical protein
MTIKFLPLPTAAVRALQAGGPDAYGHAPEVRVSAGVGVPCRHCLRTVPAGEPFLVLAYRPFDGLNAYTETGPIFLCAERCEPAAPSGAVPPMMDAPDYIVRGYDSGEAIIYGTGGVVPTGAIADRARELLGRPDVAFVHVRSARNNCFQVRVERG